MADELLALVARVVDGVVAEPHAPGPRAIVTVVAVGEGESVLLPRTGATALDRSAEILVLRYTCAGALERDTRGSMACRSGGWRTETQLGCV